jgi:pyridoxamine 5'-phosphate oxidase
MIIDLGDLRENYKLMDLDVAGTHKDPNMQFAQWFDDAKNAELQEPNAFTIATCGMNMRPSARTVLLKYIDKEGFVFFTNYQSRKAKDLAENPLASMQFLWLGLERQVRIEGTVSKYSEQGSIKYFESRPKASQIGAWASPQSQIVKDRLWLENSVKQLESKYRDLETLPKPPHWGGYILKPDYFEFWQGRPSRMHDRIAYTLVGGKWKRSRLAP